MIRERGGVLIFHGSHGSAFRLRALGRAEKVIHEADSFMDHSWITWIIRGSLMIHEAP
jgi:hypothetical protein